MSSTKYQVSQIHNGKNFVYGNFKAADAADAIQQAYKSNKRYKHQFDFKRPFRVKRKGFSQDVMANV